MKHETEKTHTKKDAGGMAARTRDSGPRDLSGTLRSNSLSYRYPNPSRHFYRYHTSISKNCQYVLQLIHIYF